MPVPLLNDVVRVRHALSERLIVSICMPRGPQGTIVQGPKARAGSLFFFCGSATDQWWSVVQTVLF